MISYLEGRLLKKEHDTVTVLVNGVGYEVLLPVIVRQTFNNKRAGEDGDHARLFISHQQTERQPKPLLIGFNLEVEQEFFERLITVEDIGPTAAAKALTVSIHRIARAIEERDTKFLTTLKGIGERKAEKIVATLHGKVAKWALMKPDMAPAPQPPEDVTKQVIDVLVKQLGHKVTEAERMVEDARKRTPQIASPEELFEEVYRGEKL